MKTLTLTLALMFGITGFSFAGNQPAMTYPAGQFATAGGNSQVTPWAKGAGQTSEGVVVAKAGNGVCPVMNHRITSKHNFQIILSNGKHMSVCCAPCKETVEKDLGKFQALMY